MSGFGEGGVSRREALGVLAGTGVALAATSPGDLLAQGSETPNRFAKFPAPKVNGFKKIGGVNIYYEDQGQGIPVVLCPGGRQASYVTRPTAAKLAGKYRVISWDRPNCVGKSQFSFKGSRDVDMWADQMVELLGELNAVPAYFAGPSMGNRTNFAIALRYPDVARGLLLYHISGNGSNLYPSLPRDYWAQYADIAEKGGMKAVAATEYWTDLLTDNPGNRAQLLATDPKEFARVMRRWTYAYKPTDLALMMTEADLKRHGANGVPTRVVAGCTEDPAHSRETSDLVAPAIASAEYVKDPAMCTDWMKMQAENTAWAKQHKQLPAKSIPYYEIPALAGQIDDFITKTEAKRGQKA